LLKHPSARARCESEKPLVQLEVNRLRPMPHHPRAKRHSLHKTLTRERFLLRTSDTGWTAGCHTRGTELPTCGAFVPALSAAHRVTLRDATDHHLNSLQDCPFFWACPDSVCTDPRDSTVHSASRRWLGPAGRRRSAASLCSARFRVASRRGYARPW
jgi:hypothetical protein